jgi:hypothetical protein
MTPCDPCRPEFPTPRDEWGFRNGDPWDVDTAADRVRVLVLAPEDPPPPSRRDPNEHRSGYRA